MYEAGAGVCVLAGVFVGRVILDAPAIVAWRPVRRAARPSPRSHLRAGRRWPCSRVFAVSLVPAAHSRIRFERQDLTAQRARTTEINLLGSVVDRLGPHESWPAGIPNIGIDWQSSSPGTWAPTPGSSFSTPSTSASIPHPVVNMYPHSYGWQVFPSDYEQRRAGRPLPGPAYRT